MQLLHSRGSYPREHGANLRKERRAFATEKAGVLARAGMAEVERQQTGETRRAKMEQKTELAAKQKGGLRGAGGGADSTRMKSFDFANKSMSEMFPNRINPNTNKPFTSTEWNKGVTELANSREAYGGGGLQQAEKQQPIGGMQGRGRAVTEGGRQFDIMPGVEGFQRSMASPGMMETAGFLPQDMGEGSVQIEGEEPGAGGVQETAPGAGGIQGIAPETPRLKPGEAAAMLQAEYNKENPDPNIIASLKKLVGGGMQWLKGRMLSPGGGRVESPVGLKGYMNR